ncbi:hypothetical protein [Marinimicrococcus flavescens]|uniref:Tetratricopeptide repeat protein n=1 Tax=Marinimicrococcus flavescens TaxID=3031815 RepID=A0AAP4D6F4_9PROT|nr:hypothetical protein [Marinimicrococcus flavescens]
MRYALQGSVRRNGGRVRVTAQLIDGATGGHLWAQRNDRELTSIFAVQDEVTRQIVAALRPQLSAAERQRIGGRGTFDVAAYECFLEGRELVLLHSRESVAEAQALFIRALGLDHRFPQAHACLGLTHALQSIDRWVADPGAALGRALECARHAVHLDEGNPHARFVLSVVRLWRKEVDQAICEAEQAIAHDPNVAQAHASLGHALHYAGGSAESLPAYERMARLDPHHPPVYLHFIAQSLFALGYYEKAASTLRQRLIRQPDSTLSRVLLAACYGHMGRAGEACAQWQEALRSDPDYSLEHRRLIAP